MFIHQGTRLENDLSVNLQSTRQRGSIQFGHFDVLVTIETYISTQDRKTLERVVHTALVIAMLGLTSKPPTNSSLYTC